MRVAVGEIPGRIRRGIRRHGLVGALRAGSYLRERPIWFRLDLTQDRPLRELPEGMTLRRGDVTDVASLRDELLRVRPEDARARFDVPGTELWVVEEDGLPRFACWLFRQRTPVSVAAGSWLVLPLGVVCLEDSMAAAAVRGRGVAPAVWSQLAGRLAADGATALITKVDAANTPSRRAVGKAGFVEILPMDVLRLGPLWRARALKPPDEPLGRELLEKLAR